MIAAALFAAAVAVDSAALADLTLLPADGSVAGCNRSGPPETYPGAELYGLIDGGAEPFLELGFVRATVQRYAFAGQEVSLELYRMRDPGAALGIYLMKCGKETTDPALPMRHTVGRVQLQLVRGDFYLTATGDRAADGLRAALVGLAAVAVSREPEAATDPLAGLPGDHLVAGSARIVRGAYTLQALVTLGEGDVLQLQEDGVTALAGEYRGGDGPRQLLIQASYASAAAAVRALANVEAGLDPYLTPVLRAPDRLEVRDPKGALTSITREGTCLRVRVELRN